MARPAIAKAVSARLKKLFRTGITRALVSLT